MDSKTFGEVAVQLLGAAQIPGSQLDMALEFRRMAEALAQGRTVIVEEPPA